MVDDRCRQFGLLTEPEAASSAPSPAAVAALASTTADANVLGAVLSPSQLKCYLGCSACWWFKYGAGLADPPSGSLVRGRVVHKVAECVG